MKRRDPNITSIADKYIGRDGSAPKEPSEAELDAMTVRLDQAHILAGLGEMSPGPVKSLLVGPEPVLLTGSGYYRVGVPRDQQPCQFR